MDISKKRVLMCEKAVELQQYFHDNQDNLRPSFLYDYLLDRVCVYLWMPLATQKRFFPNSKYQALIFSIEETRDKNTYLEEQKGAVVWLPSQGQLQEILNSSFPPLGILDRLEHVYKQDKNYWTDFETFEQLWLAFVMHEKYNKTWKGGDWEPCP